MAQVHRAGGGASAGVVRVQAGVERACASRIAASAERVLQFQLLAASVWRRRDGATDRSMCHGIIASAAHACIKHVFAALRYPSGSLLVRTCAHLVPPYTACLLLACPYASLLVELPIPAFTEKKAQPSQPLPTSRCLAVPCLPTPAGLPTPA